MILNHAGVDSIYKCVGNDRFESLLLKKCKVKKDTDKRPIAETTIDLIIGIIKRHKNPDRRTVIAKSYLSPSTVIAESCLSSSTVNNAISILFERGVIKKKISESNTVSYSLSKK